MNVLELDGVRAGYDKVEVLHGVDLTVGAGEVMALLGPNGAGKTTLLRVACGLHPLRAGTLSIAGRDVGGAPADGLARCGVCTIPGGQGVFPNLTVRENLLMATHAGTQIAEVESRAYEQFPSLRERRTQPAGTLSGGEQQMLAMARALATDPVLLLLDELSMGLAPLVVDRLYEIVAAVAAAGVSILVVEQFAQTVLKLADRAAVMIGGRVAAMGAPADIASQLSAHYLGGSVTA